MFKNIIDKKENKEEKFDKLFKEILENYFKHIGNIQYSISNDIGFFTLGLTTSKYDHETDKLVLKRLCFNEGLLNFGEPIIKMIIKHELIHCEQNYEFKNNTRGIMNLIFPHGLDFIKKSIRVHNYIDAVVCILFLGLKGVNFRMFKYITFK